MSRKPTTYVLCIVDMSGSMATLAPEVRSGFNGYLDGLAADDVRYRVSTTVFDTEFTPLCTAAKLKDTPRLDTKNYQPRGTTALLDAVGKTVSGFDTSTRLGPGDRVLVIVMTDGCENASQEFSSAGVTEMVREREASGQWTFLYLGAGLDAWGQGVSLGLRSVQTVNTAAGTAQTYDGIAAASRAYAHGASPTETHSVLAAAVAGDQTV